MSPVSFTVEKYGRGWLVGGMMTMGGKIDAHEVRRLFKTKKEAEVYATKVTQAEIEARAYVAQRDAARKAEAERKKEERRKRKSRQGNLFDWADARTTN